jgi:hypothetical protein
MLREQKLHTVCEEAACPNIGECFGRGTATFMILGDICTRRCPFCDVGHGKPLPPDVDEPAHLADSVARLQLRYVVITSVDRDDLRDGGAQHFVEVISAVRRSSPTTTIETLVPDFRGRMEIALEVLGQSLPDVLNHNMETVPRLYRQARPGADYAHSLAFMKGFKARYPQVPTKSGLMVGLGETDDEILDGAARPACQRCRNAHHRSIPGAIQPPPAGRPLRASGCLQDVRAAGLAMGLPVPPAGRWCVRATGRTCRRKALASPERGSSRALLSVVAHEARRVVGCGPGQNRYLAVLPMATATRIPSVDTSARAQKSSAGVCGIGEPAMIRTASRPQSLQPFAGPLPDLHALTSSG